MAVAEPVFHPDSYGYRPRRGALDAVAVCRKRCWEYDWVVEFDIARFFDSVPWDKIVACVAAHTEARWVVLYVRRWLAAGLQMPDGSVTERDLGTPQGSAVSPVLANLFLHHAFDVWMGREFPDAPFERYADDGVIHCRTLEQAQQVLAALTARMAEVGLWLHPDKTKIVYCGVGDGRGGGPGSRWPHTAFTFLGFTFRPRKAVGKGGVYFTGFLPAISAQASEEAEQGGARAGTCTGGPPTTEPCWPRRSTRCCQGGWRITAGSTARRSTPLFYPCQHLLVAVDQEEVPRSACKKAVRRLAQGFTRSARNCTSTGSGSPPAGVVTRATRAV